MQWVIPYGGDRRDEFRGYARQIASGELRVGDGVIVQPSGILAKVQSLQGFDGPREAVQAGDTITVVLDRDVDMSRYDMLVRDEAPARRYPLKHSTRLTSARLQTVHSRCDIHDMGDIESANSLEVNDISRVTLAVREPLAVGAYAQHAATGAFVLIDEAIPSGCGGRAHPFVEDRLQGF